MKEQKYKMRRYIGKVVRLFMDNDYSLKTVNDFHRWLSKDDNVDEKNEILKEEWDRITINQNLNTSKSFNDLLDKLGVETVERSNKHIHLKMWKYISAAVIASCIMSVAATKLVLSMDKHESLMVECYSPYGQVKDVRLPDGSKVNLNSGSYILYSKDLEGYTRDIYLVGEAVFDVAPNKEKPFIVHSGEVSVTALGTKFNVKAYPEDEVLRATLLEGKVKVGCKGTKEYFLNPGQQLKHNKLTHEVEIKDVDGNFVTAWQRGEIILHKSSIKEIYATLEAKYGIEFRSFKEDNLTQDLFNFTFKEDASIEEVLEIMKIVIGNFDYKLKNNICYIYWNNKI